MNRFLTALFYGSIGLTASIILFLAFYWSLSLNSSIYSLINNTKGEPLYLALYAIFTFGTILLFGINLPLLVYRWRRLGPPKIRSQGGSFFGSVVGVAASACPVCGSLLLSAIGIGGGLAAFPLQGLELKALSFGLMALPIVLTNREIAKFNNCTGNCPVPADASFKKSDWPILIASLVVLLILALAGWSMVKSDPIFQPVFVLATVSTGNITYVEAVAKVLPPEGFQSKIYLGDSVLKLVDKGVIDKNKFEAIYKERGGLPPELNEVLTQPSYKPMLLTRDNANVYVNLLWPLGLTNYMSTNKSSPILGESLFNFASTGGWDLGRQENGGAYFNKFKIVELTPQQKTLVTQIAKNTYRPCCNNSTFFQDCNRGSALLGLLQLGASQGLGEEQLYKEALAFNSHWFPHNYIQTALYFKIVKNIDWENVDPKEVLGYEYSAVSNWAKNVQSQIAKIPNPLPLDRSGGGCGV